MTSKSKTMLKNQDGDNTLQYGTNLQICHVAHKYVYDI